MFLGFWYVKQVQWTKVQIVFWCQVEVAQAATEWCTCTRLRVLLYTVVSDMIVSISIVGSMIVSSIYEVVQNTTVKIISSNLLFHRFYRCSTAATAVVRTFVALCDICTALKTGSARSKLSYLIQQQTVLPPQVVCTHGAVKYTTTAARLEVRRFQSWRDHST